MLSEGCGVTIKGSADKTRGKQGGQRGFGAWKGEVGDLVEGNKIKHSNGWNILGCDIVVRWLRTSCKGEETGVEKKFSF